MINTNPEQARDRLRFCLPYPLESTGGQLALAQSPRRGLFWHDMTEADRKRKLVHISRLTAEELKDWVWAINHYGRPYAYVEQAALMKRANELGVEI